jgi:hypothetical protein
MYGSPRLRHSGAYLVLPLAQQEHADAQQDEEQTEVQQGSVAYMWVSLCVDFRYRIEWG